MSSEPSPLPATRAGGLLLLEAIKEVTNYLGETWLDVLVDAPIDEILDAYAADHLRQSSRIDTRSTHGEEEV